MGATGAVGETILQSLWERSIPVREVSAFASRARPAAVRFGDRSLDVRETTPEALVASEVVFFAGAEEAGPRYIPALLQRGRFVIDNSPAYRMNDGVPLIVPEINADAVRSDQRLFPVANCTAIVLCVALAPIRDLAGLGSVRVATYQAASGAGRRGLDELLAGERAALLGEPEPQASAFAKPLARNVIPKVGELRPDGYTGEEHKIAQETRKILDLPDLFASVTAVRVPVRTAHAEAVFVETERPTTIERLAQAFAVAPGIAFERDGIPTPREAQGTDLVWVGRLRAEEPEPARRFALWCVGDQLRKGAATNAVQILELLIAKGMVTA